MNQKSYKRRNYFIKKDLQGKYIISYFIHIFLGSLVFAIILSLFSAKTVTVMYNSYGLQLGKTPVMIFREILAAHWLIIVLAGIVVVIGSMLFTHRIAGPLFKFERTLDRMITKDFSFTIYLRQNDEEKELAEKINHLLNMLSDNLGEVKQINRELLATLGNISQQGMEADSASAMKRASSLAGRQQEILDGFKVQNS